MSNTYKTEYADLLHHLSLLARGKHDDVSIAADAAGAITALLVERDALRKALGRILENEASDWKAAEEFGGYVLADELREEARAAMAGRGGG